MAEPMIQAEIEVKVEFYDVDPMNVVWHGNYVRYLEAARGALLDKIGYNYPQMREDVWTFPIVDLHLHYARPALYGQRLKVRASLAEWENRLRVEYLVLDAATGQKLTKASSIQVAVHAQTGEMSYVLPEAFTAKVKRLLG